MFRFVQDSIYPNPHDPIYDLERQLHHTTGPKRLALFYNDAKNHQMAQIPLYDTWLAPRLALLDELRALPWETLDTHLRTTAPDTPELAGYAKSIRTLLEKPFDLATFCLLLSRMDHLRTLLLPRHLEGLPAPFLAWW